MRTRYQDNPNFLNEIEEKKGKEYLTKYCFYESQIRPMLNINSGFDDKKNVEWDILVKINGGKCNL